MCDRCDAWEYVIDNWFGENLLQMLEVYVAQRVERTKPHPGERYATENKWLIQTANNPSPTDPFSGWQ